MKKLIILGVVALFLCLAISPAVNSMKLDTNKEGNELLELSTGVNYYAVLAGCVRYIDSSSNLPIATYKLKEMKQSLEKAYNDWNIKALYNEEASKQDIIDALDWAADNVRGNDIFLFSWQGHGSEVLDDDGDEGLFDRYDEVICPYDCYRDHYGALHNYITDDELDNYLDKINAKSMVLMFDSCLSGGMVDEDVLDELTGGDGIIDETEKDNWNIQGDLEVEAGIEDVDGPGRIVLVDSFSGLPKETLGRGSYIFGFPMTWTVAHSLSKGIFGPANDQNNDGWVSVSESWSWSKPRITIENGIFWGFIWTIFFIEQYSFTGDITAALDAALWTMFEFVYVQLITRLATGHFMMNWPTMQDQCPEEVNLVKIDRWADDPDDIEVGMYPMPSALWDKPAYSNLPESFTETISQDVYESVSWDDIPLNEWPELLAIADYEKDSNNKNIVHFTADAQGPLSDGEFSWNFGDGATSTEQNPTHVYTEEGKYTVILSITDNKDRTASDSIVDLDISKSKSRTSIFSLIESLISEFPIFKQLYKQALTI